MLKAEFQGGRNHTEDASEVGALSESLFFLNVQMSVGFMAATSFLVISTLIIIEAATEPVNPSADIFGRQVEAVTAVRMFCQLSGGLLPSPSTLSASRFPLRDSSGGGAEGGSSRAVGGGRSGHICCFAASLRLRGPGELIRTSRSVGRTTAVSLSRSTR